MRVILLAVGTLLSFMYIIQMMRGSKYKDMLAGLNNADYPFYNLYVVGLAWNSGKLLNLKGKVRDSLMSQARLLYDPQYAEYYSTLVWAQIVTFAHLMLALGFLFAGLVNSSLMVFVGIIFGAVFGYYFMTKMKTELDERKTECVSELPEVVSTMALLINSGMVLREAWRTIASSKEGVIYKLMRDACEDMDNGVSETDALHNFGVLSNSGEVKKFIGSLIQGMEKGGKDLSIFLVAQSSEMWELKKQIMLQKGEAAASKLLIPTTLIFAGILIVVMGGAIGTLI